MLFETMTGAVSRRRALGALAGASAVVPGLALGGVQAGAAPRGGGTMRPLDVMDPRENLYGFAKMWGTIGEKAVISAYHGTQYAIIGKERARPLFNFCGFGNIRNVIQPDGTVKVMGKECSVFTDLHTGEVLDTWDNPWTGEKVKVYSFYNDAFRGSLGLTKKVYQVNGSTTVNNSTGEGAGEAAEEPFLLPWQKFGDQYLLGWDYAHEYPNPVTKALWPKASTGPVVNPSEHFTIYTPVDEIDDRSLASARYHAGFTRQGPWWPWMMMGESGVDGVLMGRMHSYKITGTAEDILPAVRRHVERVRPDLFEEPTDGPDHGVVDTWGRYARDVAPEVPAKKGGK
ncbi:DUF1838 family protein [Novosphingobium sp. YJ-S2-02]|uniref:DUF1838 family protein n=1 Tax=Novosphingobium aureum TaxID=2792964 RepID=A0A931HC79_9SPHN|nr:DUF1838 family protein [Novosphingobium aureum]MBH0113370.1 DUF1838 family protein [Novosphingobium aureum]